MNTKTMKILVVAEKELRSSETRLAVLPVAFKESVVQAGLKRQLLEYRSLLARGKPAKRQTPDAALSGVLRLAKRRKYTGQPGARLDIPISSESEDAVIRLSAVSDAAMENPESRLDEWRRLGGDACSAAARLGLPEVFIALTEIPPAALGAVLEAVAEGLLLAGAPSAREAVGTARSSGKSGDRAVTRAKVMLVVKSAFRGSGRVLERAHALAAAVIEARRWVNLPPNFFQPGTFVKEARKLQGRRIRVTAYGEPALRKLGAGALLGVAMGSDAPCYLLHLVWRPRSKRRQGKRVVLVGKGVTFDSGGLSIKTRAGMEEMKCDMAGGAAVLGVFHVLKAIGDSLGIDHEVHALIPTVENMINGHSLRGGDVVSTISGKTIEVLNVDAEGRLILADAFGFASRLKPDILIDIATLTGSCAAALGSQIAGIFTADDELEKLVREVGERNGEKFWRLPLAHEYRDQLKSNVADLRNIGTGDGPGATVAALFLEEFVPPNCRWAHIDMVGPAYFTPPNEYRAKGATGFGVATLLRLLESRF